MSTSTQQIVLSLIAGILILVALALVYLLVRRDPKVLATRVGLFLERERVADEAVDTPARGSADTTVGDDVTREWPAP